MKRKGLFTLGLAAGLSVCASISAFAGYWVQHDNGEWEYNDCGWKQDSTGWWYKNEDGSYPVSTWQWIDEADRENKEDGVMFCYYFDANGYLVTNTVIDGNLPFAEWLSCRLDLSFNALLDFVEYDPALVFDEDALNRMLSNIIAQIIATIVTNDCRCHCGITFLLGRKQDIHINSCRFKHLCACKINKLDWASFCKKVVSQ